MQAALKPFQWTDVRVEAQAVLAQAKTEGQAVLAKARTEA